MAPRIKKTFKKEFTREDIVKALLRPTSLVLFHQANESADSQKTVLLLALFVGPYLSCLVCRPVDRLMAVIAESNDLSGSRPAALITDVCSTVATRQETNGTVKPSALFSANSFLSCDLEFIDKGSMCFDLTCPAVFKYFLRNLANVISVCGDSARCCV